MAFGQTLYTKLTGHAGLSALVSTRVYPGKFKQQGTLPAIRYTRISSDHPSAMSADVGLTDYRYQFDIVAGTYAAADAVLIQLKNCLQRWRSSGDGVQDSFLINESDDFEPDNDQYRIRVDVRFIVQEAF